MVCNATFNDISVIVTNADRKKNRKIKLYLLK